MRKTRILYGIVLLSEILLLFWSGSGLLLGVLATQFLLLLLLEICIVIDTERLQMAIRMPAACLAGRRLSLTLQIDKRFFLAAGMMQAVLECENRLMDERTDIPVWINFSGQNHSVEIPFQAEACGQIRIRLNQIRCYDIFGLLERDIPFLDDMSMLVYPRETALQVSSGRILPGGWEGEQRTLDRRGKDLSEVFDLREYRPGDDVRAIHWKLSGKTDTLLVREASDTFRCDTYILLDAGKKEGTRPYPVAQLSAAVSAAVSVSQRLLELGISHYTGIAAGGRLLSSPVAERAEFQRMLDIWMAMRLPEQKGTGLGYFMRQQLQRHYNRLIYITNGMCPESFFDLPSGLEITAVCILEDSEESSVRQQENCTIMEIPLGELWKMAYTISI